MLSSIGDGVGKINQAVPGYFGAENLRAMTGIDAAPAQSGAVSSASIIMTEGSELSG